MEDSSPYNEKTIAMTAELARDLREAIIGKLPKATPLSEGVLKTQAPKFGSVYFGPLKWFADGDPHYGMVKGSPNKHLSPELPFSPITTKKQKGRRKRDTVLLAPGTLPTRGDRGAKLMKPSRILLFYTIPISLRQMRKLMEEGRMHFVQRLNEAIREQARVIIARL